MGGAASHRLTHRRWQLTEVSHTNRSIAGGLCEIPFSGNAAVLGLNHRCFRLKPPLFIVAITAFLIPNTAVFTETALLLLATTLHQNENICFAADDDF